MSRVKYVVIGVFFPLMLLSSVFCSRPTEGDVATCAVPDDSAITYGASVGEAASRSGFVRDYWPTADWRYTSAEEQGMNSSKLEEMMGLIRSEGFLLDSVVVIRNGYVVMEEYPRPNLYSQNTSHLLYSATKSFTSALIGIALAEGYIDNVQHRLLDFFPNRTIANMSSQKQVITLENVLTMSSGLQWDEWTYPPYDPRNSVTRMTQTQDWVQYVLDQPMAHDPGTVWTYNGGGSHLLSAVLNETTGTNAEPYAREKLFHPLGINQEYWMTDYTGLTLGYTHLFLRPLDMAKFGFLYLNGGVWDGEQIVPAEWVRASTEAYYQVWPESDVYYGYQWWMRPSVGYYWAWGMAGQTIAVIPDYDMVVVFTGSVTDYDPGQYLIEHYILPAAAALPIVVPNDFPTIQKAINNAAEGDTVYVKTGTYYEHLDVNKTISLLGESRDTTVVDGNWTGIAIDVTRNGVIISNFTVQRSGSVHWENAGICIDTVENCTISKTILTENPFAGLMLNWSRYCVVSGNNIHDNSGVGVTMVGSSFNNLSQNTIAKNGWSALTLNEETHNNTISENDMISNNLVVTGHCINLYRSEYNLIQNNYITGDDNGIRLEYWSDYNMVANNNITDNSQAGLSVEMYSAHNTISNNYVANNSEIGIWIQNNAIHNVVHGNNVTGSRHCIQIMGQANNNTISENTLTGGRFGIQILDSRYTEIFNNTIAHIYRTDEWDAGIRLDYSGYTRIIFNNITGNWLGVLLYSQSPYVSVFNNSLTYNNFGFRAIGGSDYVSLVGNHISHSAGYGVGVIGIDATINWSNHTVISDNEISNNNEGIILGRISNQNTITFNNISMNQVGLYLSQSTQNLIYGNKILSNCQQINVASSTASDNAWDGGYVIGGNYWSGYLSSDLFGGPCQNITGGDGIGDTPYVIDANDRDNYPFMLLSVCNVSQIPVSEIILPGEQVEICATITHLYSVERAKLNYTIANSTGKYDFSLSMTNAEGDVWSATIPAYSPETTVTYVISGQDSEGNMISSEQQGYTLEYQIVPEFSSILVLPILAITLLLARASLCNKRAVRIKL